MAQRKKVSEQEPLSTGWSGTAEFESFNPEVLKDLQFNFYLVVKNPFRNYQKGNEIRQDDAIQKVINDGDLSNCLKVTY